MKTKVFTTNLKCEGCVGKVGPVLDAMVGEGKWKVDLESTERLLTVTGDGVDSEGIVRAFKDKGFDAKEKRGFFGKLFG